MSSVGRIVGFLILAEVFLPTARAETADNNSFEFSGTYKNLAVSSRTLGLFPPQQSYWVDLNRLRLKVKGRLATETSFNIEYDNELFFGNYLTTNQFLAQKTPPSDTYFNFYHTYVDDTSVYGRHGLYRAYVDTRIANTDLRIGRQRIAWGSALFWSPVDIINPFDPTQIERDERKGVDAIAIDRDYSELSRFSLAYAAHAAPVRATTAVRWRTNLSGYDWGVTAGRFRNDDMAGIDFAGQLDKVGVRGEITGTQSPVDGIYTRLVMGADYTFQNTLSLNAEIYFNGQGETNSAAYDFNRLFSGEIQSLAQRYAGLYAGYEITPLLKWKNYYINNLDDQSQFYAPELVYSITENSEAKLGAQFFAGNAGSEYAAFENAYYLQWQWFF